MKICNVKLHPAFFAWVIIILCCPKFPKAQAKLEMDEYLQEFYLEETVFPQEKNEIQLTLKPSFTKYEQRQLYIPLAVEYGLTDRLQIEVEVPYLISSVTERQRIRGMGNVEVGLMYNILKSYRPFSLSVGMNKTLQTAGKYIRAYQDEPSWEAYTVVARQLGSWQMHGNFRTELVDGQFTFNYGMASVFNFGRCNATFEVTANKEEERIFYFTPGLIWKQPNGLEFGMALSKSFNKYSDNWSLVAMLIYEFSIFSKKD